MPCVPGDANVSAMGNCMVDMAFGGDFIIGGAVVLLLFGFLLWKTRSPASVVLPIGFVLVYALMAWDTTIFGVIYYLGLLVMGVAFGMLVLKFGRK